MEKKYRTRKEVSAILGYSIKYLSTKAGLARVPVDLRHPTRNIAYYLAEKIFRMKEELSLGGKIKIGA